MAVRSPGVLPSPPSAGALGFEERADLVVVGAFYVLWELNLKRTGSAPRYRYPPTCRVVCVSWTFLGSPLPNTSSNLSSTGPGQPSVTGPWAFLNPKASLVHIG